MKVFGNKKSVPAKEKKKKRKIRPWMVICIVILALVMSGAAYYKMTVKPPEVPKLPDSGNEPGSSENEQNPPTNGDEPSENLTGRKKEFYTFILAGTDLDDYHTDTLMVASYDAVNKKLHVVSVPRDTMINVTWSTKKINSAYGVGGIERLKEELKKVIGFVPDFYATVDLKGFVKMVDAIGGVQYDVPMKMYKPAVDHSLDIDLKAGPQKLNGTEALMLVRWRDYPQGDTKRIEVQQDFLKELAKQTIKISNVTKINEFSKIGQQYLKSDLSLGNMVWLGQELMELDSETDIEFHTLPGNPDVWYKNLNYVGLYKNQVVEMVNKYLNPYIKDITAKDLDILVLDDGSRPGSSSSSASPPEESSPPPSPSGNVTGTAPPSPSATQEPPRPGNPDETTPVSAPPSATQPPPSPSATQTQTPATQTPTPTPPPGPTMEPTRPPD